MMKIDIDRMTKRNIRFIISLRKPYEIRAGNKGVNIRSDCPGCTNSESCYNCWIYSVFDDQNRLKLNRQQEFRGLSHNILWDIKKGKAKPGEWVTIESERDADRYLRQFTGLY